MTTDGYILYLLGFKMLSCRNKAFGNWSKGSNLLERYISFASKRKKVAFDRDRSNGWFTMF